MDQVVNKDKKRLGYKSQFTVLTLNLWTTSSLWLSCLVLLHEDFSGES